MFGEENSLLRISVQTTVDHKVPHAINLNTNLKKIHRKQIPREWGPNPYLGGGATLSKVVVLML